MELPSRRTILNDTACEVAHVIESVGLTQDFWNATQLNEAIDMKITQAITAGGNTAVTPVGTIIWHSAVTPPEGYMIADGGVVSRTEYDGLFAVIGETYGAGDGSTTFNLPDLRGEFVRGWDSGRGIDSGRVFGSWQEDEFKNHNHSLPISLSGGSGSAATTTVKGGSQKTSSSTGGVETRPRNLALLPCIKY